MALKEGMLVRYKSMRECVGILLQLGQTTAKVRWNDEDIVEWVPFYALEAMDV